jgi:hypothetical protein
MKNLKKTIMNDGFLPINYKITKKIGIEASMLLSLLINAQDYYDNQPFYKTQNHIEDEIGMTKKVFLKCKKILVEEGLITTWFHTNSTPYYFITDECYDNIQKILGVFPKGEGGVPKGDGACSEKERGVFPKGEGGVPKGNTNNNKLNNKLNNKEIELSNNNKEEKLTKNSVEYDEADMYINGNKKLKLEPTPSKPKNGIFDNIDI